MGAAAVLLKGCLAREFAAMATNADRPVAHYLRALARDLDARTPGKGVGVIGQCFTCGFALAAEEGLCAMGLRFNEDAVAPGARFTTLKARLGDAFEIIEISSAKGNPDGIGRLAHSVLTDQVREIDGNPAYEARKRVVAFSRQRFTA